MSSNRKVTDFFKPFAEPRVKRPLTIDIAEDATALPPSPQSDSSRVEQSTFKRHEQPVTEVPSEQNPRLEAPKLEKPGSCGSETATDGRLRSSQNGISESAGPLSSQSFSNTSSHRVIRHGEIVVTNSDDEDSDSSLDDIDSLLTHRKPAPTPTPDAEAIERFATRSQPKRNGTTQSKLWHSRKSRKSPFTPIQALPKYRFSLDSLVSRAEKDAASEAEVFRARAMMWNPAVTSEQDHNDAMDVDSQTAATENDVETDQGLLAAVVTEETEGSGVHSVLHAMKRTEVGNGEKVWYFLGDRSMLGSTHRLPFPHKSLPSKNWQTVLGDSTSREQTFVSGAAGEMLATESLPDEIIQWILDELCFEPRDDLRSAYVLALQATASKITTLLTPSCIDEMFSKLGARREALDVRQVATPSQQELNAWREVRGPPWAQLETVIKALTGVAENLFPPSREHAILIMARILLDSSLTANGSLLLTIEDALETLIDGIPSNELESSLYRISTMILASVTDCQMRLQFLSHFPTHSHTLHLLRRRLALTTFFSDPVYLNKPSDNLIRVPEVTHHLHSSAFNIDNDTNYIELATTASILDIAIDDGLSLNTITDRHAIETFNQDIDTLTARIKFLFTSILDSGASHMTRTEAKEALERVHYRLVYTVRTKPVTKKRIFEPVKATAGGGDQAASEKGVMARYLAKQESTRNGC
ncbi:MAG: hypothetical protein M1836_004673 [Candelina mexicana]|nr:MAG: hypothetical protein M1836_004673 [Candelina mexicana]